ncbi:MAG: AAA-like domain-containing protein [Cyanobacteria bacterium P01_F01_bin.150]
MGNRTRYRGVILSQQGLKRLNQAKAAVEIEHGFERFTLEALSEKTGLTPTTLSKVFNGIVKVDKRTLKCCFDAFNLTLDQSDYSDLRSGRAHLTSFNIKPSNDVACAEVSIPIPGGHLPLNSEFYIHHSIIESLCYEKMRQIGTTINIQAPQEMGKTSLIKRILAYCKTQEFNTVSLNLQLLDRDIFQDLGLFSQWVCAMISKQLGLPNQVSTFWDVSLGSKANTTHYLEDIILAHCDRPLVIAIDELNQLVDYPTLMHEFLLLLRTWSEQSKSGENPWHKLRVVIARSTEILPSSSLAPSLLNMGLLINLPEFDLAQIQDLASRYGQALTPSQVQQMITLLGRHPYRLQLAFYSLQQQTITIEDLLKNTKFITTLYAEHLRQQQWNLKRHHKLLPIFTKIINTCNPVEVDLLTGRQLQAMGLVHQEGKWAQLSCELFRLFFADFESLT